MKRLAICMVCALAALYAPPAAAQAPPNVRISVSACGDLDPDDIERLIRIELGDQPLTIDIACADGAVELTVDTSRGTRSRTVDSESLTPRAKERALATIVVELYDVEPVPAEEPDQAPAVVDIEIEPPGVSGPRADVAAAVTTRAVTERGGVSAGYRRDAAFDRAFVMPTAFPLPEGTATVDSREVVFVGFSHGVTERLTVSATVLPPLDGFGLYGDAKFALRQTDSYALAAHGLVVWSRVGGDEVVIGGAGLAGSLCLSPDCESLVTAAAHAGVSHSGDSDAAVIASAAGFAKLVPHVKLMAEGISFVPEADVGEGVILGFAGARLHSRRWALDVGAARALTDDGDGVYPWVALRWRPN